MSSRGKDPIPGLRERKKAKTRAAIQRHALRLFREQGYDATTVEQIAAAVEVSPSTFFRYFPTKEDVVLYDDLDPVLIAAFGAQPGDLTPIQALRGALRAVFAGLSADQMTEQWERMRLILAIPELRMRMLDQFASMIDLVADLVARRSGRGADDIAVRAYAGAIMGALLAPVFAGTGETLPEFLARMDAGLAFLEAGLPL
ncbi:MAG TPA: TetR family transcriptional regulator [Ktedonobacterales bacterium]